MYSKKYLPNFFIVGYSFERIPFRGATFQATQFFFKSIVYLPNIKLLCNTSDISYNYFTYFIQHVM